jgi:DNA-binding beta-propeller fold protein YncE
VRWIAAASVEPPAACCDAGSDPGFFTRPRGALVWNDDVWVIDEAGGGRLIRLDEAGAYIAELPLGFIPAGMAVSPGSGRLWILDETNNLIKVYQ